MPRMAILREQMVLGDGNSADALTQVVKNHVVDQIVEQGGFERCLQSVAMVGLGRLELPTSRLSGVRSNHLSYRPLLKLRDFEVQFQLIDSR